ncbi:MAG: LD-carboxypeptidase [Waddliaceae bacterium]
MRNFCRKIHNPCFLSIFVFCFCWLDLRGEIKPIAPPALKKGDAIGVIAPASSPSVDLTKILRDLQPLRQKGYRIKVAPNVTHRYGYLAGGDEERAKALMDMWLDPEVKAIWCYRGGYGCTRILDRLDYEAIKKHPKVLIGMSDITALHAAIQKETGLITFLGPHVNDIFGENKSKDAEYNTLQLWKMIAPVSGVKDGLCFSYPQSFPEKAAALRPGKCRGRLIGGNLCLLSTLIGSKWETNTEGCILVLEDVNEEPYRVDEMLGQLKYAGLLDKPAGVILCSWTGCRPKKPDKSLTLHQVFDDYFSQAPYPVLLGFPSGHISGQTTLPLNALAELDAAKKTLTLLEDPVH